MPVEIEAKMKVNDLGAVRSRLQETAATQRGTVIETNTFLDTRDHSLLAKDQGLRIRHAKDVQSNAEQCTITFKGPRLQGALKSREERELSVASAKDAMALLESLGFARVLTFQKRRESWMLEGCHVELDELPHLGVFVEIEGPSDQAVMKVREMLKLGDRPLITASYIALLLTHLQERGITDRVVTLPAGSR
ncbi:MAG TPA: class IV adenylate cyclase [Tepidisphaeraceae bacterium]|jgi:adenylate cyclase class 2